MSATPSHELDKGNLTEDVLRAIMVNLPPQPDQLQEVKVPAINGWLILPAIGFILNPFLVLNNLLDTLIPMTDIAFTLVNGSIDVVLFVFSCVVVWRFFRKKRNTTLLVVAFYLTSFILTLLCGVFIAGYYNDSGFSVVRFVKAPLVACIIWIPYFLLSKRVKRTFIVD